MKTKHASLHLMLFRRWAVADGGVDALKKYVPVLFYDFYGRTTSKRMLCIELAVPRVLDSFRFRYAALRYHSLCATAANAY